MNSRAAPRIMISAAGSGSGKTTITCALLRALMKKQIVPAAFKCGPDYIDPMFHSRVLQAQSRNLDLFILGEGKCRYLLAKNSAESDLAVIEGVMGYYDGIATSEQGSSYDLARVTKTPVILLVNAKGAALSIAAIIKGFMQFRADSNIKGVILNNVSKSVFEFYKQAIEQECGVKALGYFPPLSVEHTFASRHLGLVTADEIDNLREIADRLADTAMASIDLDAILAIANAAPDLAYQDYTPQPLGKVKIAIARDKAFCFYYQDSLNLLAELGAELVEFSPLAGDELPACDGVYIGGGYPELYLEKLATNEHLRKQLKTAIEDGLPCIAECGGFMYLGREIQTENKILPMVGAINSCATMGKKLSRFGYITLTSQTDNMLALKGEQINAHEFHYSDSTNNGADFYASKPLSKRGWSCVHTTESMYAGYPHLHLWGNVEFARNFVRQCLRYQQAKGEIANER